MWGISVHQPSSSIETHHTTCSTGSNLSQTFHATWPTGPTLLSFLLTCDIGKDVEAGAPLVHQQGYPQQGGYPPQQQTVIVQPQVRL